MDYNRLYMFDASSKLYSGVLDGRLIDFGNHHQCVRVEEPNNMFKGQHCLVEIRNLLPQELHLHFNYDSSDLPELMVGVLPYAKDLAISVCVPSSCSAWDVQTHMDHVLASVNASSILYDSSCTTNQPVPLDIMDWFAIVVFSGIALLVCWATIKDLSHSVNRSALVSSFSLRYTWRQLTNVQTSPEDMSCMSGIRVIFTVVIVFIHCFLKQLYDSSVSPLTVEQELDSVHILWIDIGRVSVEVFFLLGGITRSLIFLQDCAKDKPFEFFKPLLRRYSRYTPTLAVLMLFSATLLIRCGSGPYWTRLNNVSVWGCRNLWFTGLLHISNLLYPQASCVQHSWYLAVDFQLFLVSPLLLFQLHYDPRMGLMIIATVATASLLAHLLVCIATNVDSPILAVYRISPYLLGLTLGYFIFRAKQDNRKIRIPKAVLWIGWVTSLIAVMGLLIATKIMLNPRYERIPWLDIGYAILGKTILGLAAAWVIVVCHFGYGGMLNDFLSWRGFQPLSKLALGIYLVHFDIIRIQFNRGTSYFQCDNFYMFHMGLGVLVMSGFVAVVLYLCVEVPCYSLISHYLRPTPTTTEIYKPLDQPSTSNMVMSLGKQKRGRKEL